MRGMNPWLHRYAILLAVLALAVIVSGAVITSAEVAAAQSPSAVSRIPGENLHRALAIALGALALGLAIWTSSAGTSRALQAAAWCGVAALALDAALGWHAPPLAPGVAVSHALLAHLSLSLMVAIGVATSSGWNREPERVDGSSRPLLRPLAIAIPPVVLLQIALGAAYRHNMASIMPHMTVAMGVVLLACIGSSVVLQNFPRPASMRRAAIALISIVLTQVCLGIAAFLMLVLNAAGTWYFVLVTAGHVAVGASTLAASVALAMEVWRSVLPKQAGIST